MKLGFPIKNKIALSVVLIPSLFFCSCFIPSKYPDEWAPIQKFTSECADISGFYDNLPEEFRNQPELSLGYLFQVVPLIEFYKRYHDHPTLSQIVIQFELISDEKIKTIARRGNITLGEKVLVKSSGDFDCASGKIKISGPTDTHYYAESGVVAIEFNKESRYFYKTTDGALILETVENFVGGCLFVCLPIPLVGGGSSWYLYKPIVGKKNK